MVDEETWVAPCASEATIPPSPKTIPATASSLASIDDDDVAAARLGDRIRRPRAFGGQRVDLAPRPVVDGDLVARLDQVRGHGRPHVAEADEADSHGSGLDHRSWSEGAAPRSSGGSRSAVGPSTRE